MILKDQFGEACNYLDTDMVNRKDEKGALGFDDDLQDVMVALRDVWPKSFGSDVPFYEKIIQLDKNGEIS